MIVEIIPARRRAVCTGVNVIPACRSGCNSGANCVVCVPVECILARTARTVSWDRMYFRREL